MLLMMSMRMFVLFGGALIAGIIALSSDRAHAFPQPLFEAAEPAQSAIEVGWRRRYWRRYGVWPGDPVADFESDLDVPPYVLVTPRRPRSCGEYHYWNGVACVDARYNDPYLGPR